MMVEEANEYLDHERRITDLESSLFGNERLRLQTRLEQLYETVIQQRMVLAHTVIYSRLASMGFAGLDMNTRLHIDMIGKDLMRHNEWFKGAFQETSAPDAVYAEWLKKVSATLVEHGFAILEQEVHELLSPPEPSAE